MSTPNLPIIAVAGATGLQGGSVVKFLLKDGGFRVRAMTRNLDSPIAKELSAMQSMEVVRADFDDPASLVKAFEGAYGVFGVTNYWDALPEGAGDDARAQRETRQGKALVDAAKRAGVKHFVWSTLDHTGDDRIGHFDSKAAVDDYLKASGVPRTSLYTVAYFEIFLSFFPLKRDADGTLEADWPILVTDGTIGGFAVADTGAWVLESFRKPGEWIGKDLRIISEVITARSVVKTLSELSGKKIKLREISPQAFEDMKEIPGLEDKWKNMKWFYMGNASINRDFEITKRVYPQVLSFRSWAEKNLDAIIPK